jgi:hypothetical protein
MSNTTTVIAQQHGISMPAFVGYEKPALGGLVWRQRPVRQLVSAATAAGVTKIDNCTRVSEVEHRRT